MKQILTLLLFTFCIASSGIAQPRTAVTGVVTGKEDGLPLPGVSIIIKGTTTGTTTDAEGRYSLNAPANAILQFSFIGYLTQELKIPDSHVLNVVMATDTRQLGEVVVTALGIRRERRALGYSVTEVKGDVVNEVPNQNIANSLNGKVSGLQVIASSGAPGEASRVVVRGGNKSLTGNNEALWVVDGVPISNDNDGNGANNEVEGVATPNRAADINPDDIASVTVLKGSAASVLYGNRGSNGVILITTKSGRSVDGKAVVTFTTSNGFDKPLRLPSFQSVYAQGLNGVYSEGGSRSYGPRITGQTVFSAGANANVTLQAFNPRKDFLRTGFNTDNNLSFSQGSDKSTYFLSVGYNRQNSIVPNQQYSKASLRFNGTNQISSKIGIGFNLAYIRSWGDVASGGQSGSNPFFALFNMPVSWNLNNYGYVRPDGRQINFRGGAFDNPLWTVHKTFFGTEADRILGGVNFSYKPLSWLDFSYKLGNDYYMDIRKQFRDINTGSFPQGSLINDNIYRQQINSTLLVNVNHQLNTDFGLEFTAGQDYNQRRVKQTTQTGTALTLPGIANMNNVQAFNPDFEFQSKRRLIGIFGDLKLNYKSYLFLNLTGRNEWSSTLPQSNRSYFYPGINASFVFSDAFGLTEGFMNFGKIRAGFAKTARDANPYLVFNTFVAAAPADGFTNGISFPFGAIPGFTFNPTINNANLKPENTKEVEFGAEFRFWDNRIGLDATYFHNVNANGIVPVDISPASGATNAVLNAGKTRANGIEVGLNITPVKTTDFRWDANITFSRIRSKVLETFPGVEQIYLGGFGGNPAIFAVKGERYGTIISSGYARDEKGNILVDDTGIPVPVDGIKLGHVEPDWTGGIRNSFNYKGVGLDFLIDTRQGGFLFNGTTELLEFYGVSKHTLNREQDYIFPGVNETTGAPNTVVVKRDANWYSNAQVDEAYVYKNSWVKLREANLNYTYTLKANKYVRAITLGVYGRNLFLWTKVPDVDPESSSFGTNNGQGATRMAFPTTRSFGLNLKASF